MLSPFLYEKDAGVGPGISGISTFNLTFNFGGQNLLQRLFCFNSDCLGAPTVTGFQFTPSSSSVIATYLTPAIDLQLPSTLFYPYYNVTNYPQSSVLPIPLETENTINCQNI